jgi:hypothetical protein
MSTQQLVHPAGRWHWRRWVRILGHHVSWQPRSLLLLLLVAGAFAMNPPFAAPQEARVGEYELKAAILYNLTKFVEWPAAAYADPQAPTSLCILGHDPFGSSLTAAIPKNAGDERPVLIRRLQNKEAIRGCHLLYISSSERKIAAQILATLKGTGAHVLTVGEMDLFAVHGGIIQFTLQDKQVRFEINLDAAAREGLTIRSRLLLLARIVHDQNGSSDNEESPIPSQPLRMVISAVSRNRPLTFRTMGRDPSRGSLNGSGSAQAAVSREDGDWQPGSQLR